MMIEDEAEVKEILSFFKDRDASTFQIESPSKNYKKDAHSKSVAPQVQIIDSQNQSSFSFASQPRAINEKKKEKALLKVVSRPQSTNTDGTNSNEMNAQKSASRKEIVIAKKTTSTPILKSKQEEVPLSVLTSKQKGPKRDDEGNIMEQSLLGSPEDFVELKV